MMVGGQRRALSRSAGFASGAVALAAVFLASGTPIPLYARYRVEYHITGTDLAITTVAYLAATALSLLMLGRLSDHLGRKRVGIAAVLIATCALVVLMNMHTLPILILGRCLQGAACGVASTALASWVIDIAPANQGWLPAFLTGTVPPFALPVGAMLSGALAEYGPVSRTLMFQLTAAVLVLLAVLLMFSQETVVRRAGAMRSLVPRVHVPEGRGRLLFAVGAVSAAGLATLLQRTAAADRAGLMATVYLISYSGAAIPSLIAGQLAKTVEVSDIATGYAVLVTVAKLTAALTITRRRSRGESRSGARTLALSKRGRSDSDRSQQVGTLDVRFAPKSGTDPSTAVTGRLRPGTGVTERRCSVRAGLGAPETSARDRSQQRDKAQRLTRGYVLHETGHAGRMELPEPEIGQLDTVTRLTAVAT